MQKGCLTTAFRALDLFFNLGDESRKGFLSVAWKRNDPDPQISSKAGVELSAAAMVLTADGDLIRLV